MGISKTKGNKTRKGNQEMNIIQLIVFIVQMAKAVPRTHIYQVDQGQIKMAMSDLRTEVKEPLGRSVRASKCALRYNGLCIPPCWRYAGRSRRRCNFTETRRHIAGFLMDFM